MTLDRSRRFAVVAAFVLVSAPLMLVAQPGTFGGGYGPPLAIVAPPKIFSTSGVWIVVEAEAEAMFESLGLTTAEWQAANGIRYALTQRLPASTG